jgi:hypothetical protein
MIRLVSVPRKRGAIAQWLDATAGFVRRASGTSR